MKGIFFKRPIDFDLNNPLHRLMSNDYKKVKTRSECIEFLFRWIAYLESLGHDFEYQKAIAKIIAIVYKYITNRNYEVGYTF